MESRDTVRTNTSDFLALYTSPRLCNYIESQASHVVNAEERADAIADAWADILALNPIAVEDAMDIAATTIQRHVRAERRAQEREATADVEALADPHS